MAKQNPSFLRPVYQLWAKTNGEVDSMYKLNQYLSNKLGILSKAIADGNLKYHLLSLERCSLSGQLT